MQLFILGILLGSGSVLAFQELNRQCQAHKLSKLIKAQKQAIALLDPETHGYCRNWCHDSQAEHDSDTPWSDDQIQSATDAEILSRIKALSVQAERVWPARG